MKVFRVWKFVEDTKNMDHNICIDSLRSGWPLKLEGLSREEMNKMRTPYIIHDDWMVDEDENER